jgi:hypothetical protein
MLFQLGAVFGGIAKAVCGKGSLGRLGAAIGPAQGGLKLAETPSP